MSTTKTKTTRWTKKATAERCDVLVRRISQRQAEEGCPPGWYAEVVTTKSTVHVGMGYDRWSRDRAILGAMNDVLDYANESGRLFRVAL